MNQAEALVMYSPAPRFALPSPLPEGEGSIGRMADQSGF